MKDIVSQSNLNTALLDAIARAALGKATSGVSVGGGVSRIHLMNHNLPEQQRASDVLNHFDTLAISVDATGSSVASAGPLVRCADERIAADRALAYVALRADEVIAQGELAVADGECALNLSAFAAGAYVVLLYQLAAPFASGSLRIRVGVA